MITLKHKVRKMRVTASTILDCFRLIELYWPQTNPLKDWEVVA